MTHPQTDLPNLPTTQEGPIPERSVTVPGPAMPAASSVPEGSIANPTLATLGAPSFAPQVDTSDPLEPLAAGHVVGDFELVSELGRGGFATVFLARQLSLKRLVAVKLGPNRGHEAQTLASLEHEHIVQVYSETVDRVRNLRLLCMQYIPGATLQHVMAELPPPRKRQRGQDFLQALDRVGKQPEEFRPAALREREELGRGDFAQAICWLGAKLAHALAFAHRQGVLHRDIKPANILMNAYGRPYLADFNLSTSADEDPEANFGGTLAYMSPEHLAAFARSSGHTITAVNEQSDIYSLGLVLYELLTGSLPFPIPHGRIPSREVIAEMLQQRHEPITWPVDIPVGLRSVIHRCLAVNPADRYSSAVDLAVALEQCREFLESCRRLPALRWWGRWASNTPFLALLMLALFTNVLGSLVNISYNAVHIVGHFTTAQQVAFEGMVLYYNGFAYPLLVGITAVILWNLRKHWLRVRTGELLDTAELKRSRRLARFCIHWSMIGTLLGWLPGGILFPMVINFAENLPRDAFAHFAVSFTISGLVAVTSCYLGSTWVVTRILYPTLWAQPEPPGETLKREFNQHPPRLALFQCLAGIIPLSGAMLLLVSGSGDYGDLTFRLLVCALILFGMIGFVLAVQVCQSISRVVQAFMGNN